MIFQQWEILWTKDIQFVASQALRENLYEMFCHWYITPKDIEKVDKNTKGYVGSGKRWMAHFMICGSCVKKQKIGGKKYMLKSRNLKKLYLPWKSRTCYWGFYQRTSKNTLNNYLDIW